MCLSLHGTVQTMPQCDTTPNFQGEGVGQCGMTLIADDSYQSGGGGGGGGAVCTHKGLETVLAEEAITLHFTA